MSPMPSKPNKAERRYRRAELLEKALAGRLEVPREAAARGGEVRPEGLRRAGALLDRLARRRVAAAPARAPHAWIQNTWNDVH